VGRRSKRCRASALPFQFQFQVDQLPVLSLLWLMTHLSVDLNPRDAPPPQRFDMLLEDHDSVYKVETIGDCYMVAGGLVFTDAQVG